MINISSFAKSKGKSGSGTSVTTTIIKNGGTDFEGHYLWGQYFDDTQDISGDIKGAVNINATGNITTTKTVQGDKIKTNQIDPIDGSNGIVIDSSVNVSGDLSVDKLRPQNDLVVDGGMNINGSVEISSDIVVRGDNETDGKLKTFSGLEVRGSNSETLLEGLTTTVNIQPNLTDTYTLGNTNKRWLSSHIKNLFTNTINNTDSITTKDLTVTGSAHFFELIIDKIKAAGGAVLFTPADGFTVDIVENRANSSNIYKIIGYRLYWRAEDASGNQRDNMWQVGDQAICKSFNKAKEGASHNVSNKNYWCVVTHVSDTNAPVEKNGIKYHYIQISNQLFDGTVNPEVGDAIAMLGHRITNSDKDAQGNVLSSAKQRQSAIYIAAYESLDSGITAPLIAQYQGINDFNLSSHRKSYFDANGATFVGNFQVGDVDVDEYINSVVNDADKHAPFIGTGGTVNGVSNTVLNHWYIWDGTLNNGQGGYKDSGVLANGTNGLSAYEVYLANGGTKSQSEWLQSLIGSNGLSAYEIYLANGGTLTEQQWLESLDGDAGLSAYDIYKANGGTLSQSLWLASLKGDEGKSAYECYQEAGGTLTEQQWLESLIGATGLSAYEVYKKNTTDSPVKTETQWLESLDGKPGLSAYDIYKAQGGSLTETEWLASLSGDEGKSPFIGDGNVHYGITTIAGYWYYWDGSKWVKGVQAQGDSVSIKSTLTEYQKGTSGTVQPTGTWSTSVPTVNQGDYLWTRTTITYNNDEQVVTYSVQYISKDGQAIVYNGKDAEFYDLVPIQESATILSNQNVSVALYYQINFIKGNTVTTGVQLPTGWKLVLHAIDQGQADYVKTIGGTDITFSYSSSDKYYYYTNSSIITGWYDRFLDDEDDVDIMFYVTLEDANGNRFDTSHIEIKADASVVFKVDTDNKSIHSQITGYESQLSGYDNDVKSYKNQVSAFEQTAAGFTTQVGEVNTQYNTLSGKITSAETNISSLQQRADSIESKVTSGKYRFNPYNKIPNINYATNWKCYDSTSYKSHTVETDGMGLFWCDDYTGETDLYSPEITFEKGKTYIITMGGYNFDICICTISGPSSSGTFPNNIVFEDDGYNSYEFTPTSTQTLRVEFYNIDSNPPKSAKGAYCVYHPLVIESTVKDTYFCVKTEDYSAITQSANEIKLAVADTGIDIQNKKITLSSENTIVDGTLTVGSVDSTSTSASVQIKNGIMSIFGNDKSQAGIVFGIDGNGRATLSFYDAGGSLLYDLSPDGIHYVSVSAAKFTPVKGVYTTNYVSTINQSFINTYRNAVWITSDSGYYRFSSKFVGNAKDPVTKEYDNLVFDDDALSNDEPASDLLTSGYIIYGVASEWDSPTIGETYPQTLDSESINQVTYTRDDYNRNYSIYEVYLHCYGANGKETNKSYYYKAV